MVVGMQRLAIAILLSAAACSSDGTSSGGSSGVSGLWAWCDDDSCSALDDGGLFFSGGRVLDAYYDADAATYCTYEEVGTYVASGSTIVVTFADEEDGEETYTLEGQLLRGSNDLKRVEAAAAAPDTCPN